MSSLITLESIDGGGKSEVAEYLQNELDDVVVTKEPTDLWTGDVVRDSLQDDSSPIYTFTAFMLDRIFHLEEVIKPALESGKTVISDRYSDSTRAYQTEQLMPLFNGSRSQVRVHINSTMQPWGIEPDTTIYLDIGVETAMERCDKGDKYENRENLKEVKKNYELVNAIHSNRVQEVDAERPLDEVQEECLEIVQEEIDD